MPRAKPSWSPSAAVVCPLPQPNTSARDAFFGSPTSRARARSKLTDSSAEAETASASGDLVAVTFIYFNLRRPAKRRPPERSRFDQDLRFDAGKRGGIATQVGAANGGASYLGPATTGRSSHSHSFTLGESPTAMGIDESRSVMFEQLRDAVRSEIGKVVVGHEDAIDLLLVAAVAGGHVLVEGPPGVAKTILAGSVAQVLGVSFKRVQFTPDTVPSHLTGSTVHVMGEPRFVQGPIFTNVLLADEINRTPARTQSALLEAMQERHITHEGRTHWLPSPFMVIATQNPYEHVGVFELPESQLDRFLFKITLDYLDPERELEITRLPHRGLTPDLLGEVQPLLDIASLERAQRDMDATDVPDVVARTAISIARATRGHADVVLGAGPRAIVHLLTAAKAAARLDNRAVVSRGDVLSMVRPVLCHRLMLRNGASAEAVVDDAIAAT